LGLEKSENVESLSSKKIMEEGQALPDSEQSSLFRLSSPQGRENKMDYLKPNGKSRPRGNELPKVNRIQLRREVDLVDNGILQIEPFFKIDRGLSHNLDNSESEFREISTDGNSFEVRSVVNSPGKEIHLMLTNSSLYCPIHFDTREGSGKIHALVDNGASINLMSVETLKRIKEQLADRAHMLVRRDNLD
jgi:hypothetical protein